MGKRLALLKEILPDVSKVCALYNRDNPDESLWRTAQDAAEQLGLTLQLRESGISHDELTALASWAIAMQCDAIAMLDGRAFWSTRHIITRSAAELKIPVIGDEPAWASPNLSGHGCLFGYGPEYGEVMAQIAYQVDKILKGIPVTKIPVEQPTRFKKLFLKQLLIRCMDTPNGKQNR